MPEKTFYFDFSRGVRVDATGSSVDTIVSIPYQSADSWTIGVRNVTTPVDLSGATTWRAAVDKDFNHAIDPCCRILDADIDHSDAAAGNLSLTLDSNTATFLAALGTSESVAGYFELAGLDGDGKQIFYFRFAVELVNTLDPSGGDPPEPVGDFYSKTEVAALLAAKADKVGSDDIEITDASKGIILRLASGARFRLKMIESSGMTLVTGEPIE